MNKKYDEKLISEIESIHEQFSGMNDDFYLMLEQIIEAVRVNDARRHSEDIESADIASKNKLISALTAKFDRIGKDNVLVIDDVFSVVMEWSND